MTPATPTSATGPATATHSGAMPCPRCQATVAPGQDWCLQCGAPARTRLAPAPNWKLPVAAVAALLAVALVVLVVAFAALTDNPSDATGTTSTTATVPPPTTAAPGLPPAPAPAPGTTTPVDPSTPPAP